jgi:hypothetical protein
VPRPYLANVVSQIGDWYFAIKAQFYLHECGKITLGFLRITKPAYRNGPVILKGERELPLPDVPMPENIKQLKGIHLRYGICIKQSGNGLLTVTGSILTWWQQQKQSFFYFL